jgi:ribA/ribD-fused uncharacterized protein
MRIEFYRERDEHGWMSNFAPFAVRVYGQVWPTTEHFFQAQKFAASPDEEALRVARSPSEVAAMGRDRARPLRADWERVKDDVMRRAVRCKFVQHPTLADRLLATGDAELVEKTNVDLYWGCGVDGTGKNMLGKILMEVRADITGARSPRQRLLDERIEVRQCDITTLHVDGIVNAANSSLLGGGGVDGAIHRAAGFELAEECRALGGCTTGEAKLTSGHALPARKVIHTVGPVWRGGGHGEAALLRSCYARSLALAEQHQLGVVALPGISTGRYGYPLADAAALAAQTVRDFVSDHALPRRVILCTFDDVATAAMARALAELPA